MLQAGGSTWGVRGVRGGNGQRTEGHNPGWDLPSPLEKKKGGGRIRPWPVAIRCALFLAVVCMAQNMCFYGQISRCAHPAQQCPSASSQA